MPDRAMLDWSADANSHASPSSWGRKAPTAPVLPWVFVAVAGVLIVGRFLLAPFITAPALQTWATVFVAICVQALPFLVLGVLLSAAITAFVPAAFWTRALPRQAYAAVPVAGAAGAVLPGCECASVPVAAGLMSRGVTPAAALTFLLASPAINPVVLISTAVAFPGRPEMVLARFGASLTVAVLAGWLWLLLGRAEWLRVPRRATGRGWGSFREAAQHDLLHTGGFLIIGSVAAATFNVVLPRAWLDALAGVPWLAVPALALLAVILSICSEADAFVAASLTAFSPTAMLAFLVVGPMVDLKLLALQAGTFGRSFALRFVPLTLVLAVLASVVTGRFLL